MSNLYAFLHPVQVQEEKEIIISERFVDEEGQVVPFRIKALTQDDNDEIIKKSYRRVQNPRGQWVKELDGVEYNRRLAVCGTVWPDFTAKELCEAYGTLDPLAVPGKMLLAGEYAALVEAISTFSGFGAEGGEMAEAKN